MEVSSWWRENNSFEKIDFRRGTEQRAVGDQCHLPKQGSRNHFFYKCNNILFDPDRHSELLANYEFVHEIILVLPIVEGLSSFRDLNLPHFEKEVLPNPMFFLNISKCNAELHSYKQAKMRHFNNDFTRSYIGKIEICLPVFWMTLVYRVSCLYPKKDQCTLTIGNRKGILQLGRVRSPESIQLVNYRKRKNYDVFIIRASIVLSAHTVMLAFKFAA